LGFKSRTLYKHVLLKIQKILFKHVHTETSSGSPLRGGQQGNTASEDARRRAVAEFERWLWRVVFNIDSLTS